MDVGEFLAVPANREAVQAIVKRVLEEIEPVEAEVTLCYVEPLLDLAARHEVITADLWDEAGRFGNADLLVNLIVPLIANALARNAGTGAATVTRDEVKAMVLRVRSPRGRRLDDLTMRLNAALTERVSEEDARRAG